MATRHYLSTPTVTGGYVERRTSIVEYECPPQHQYGESVATEREGEAIVYKRTTDPTPRYDAPLVHMRRPSRGHDGHEISPRPSASPRVTQSYVEQRTIISEYGVQPPHPSEEKRTTDMEPRYDRPLVHMRRPSSGRDGDVIALKPSAPVVPEGGGERRTSIVEYRYQPPHQSDHNTFTDREHVEDTTRHPALTMRPSSGRDGATEGGVEHRSSIVEYRFQPPKEHVEDTTIHPVLMMRPSSGRDGHVIAPKPSAPVEPQRDAGAAKTNAKRPFREKCHEKLDRLKRGLHHQKKHHGGPAEE